MLTVGRLCVKIAGRDAGKTAVVVDVVDNTHVLIDGEVRRRKCNMHHLEPLKETIAVKKGASHAEVAKEFKKLSIELKERKAKKPGQRPIRKRILEQVKRTEKKKARPAKVAKKTDVKKEKKAVDKKAKKTAKK